MPRPSENTPLPLDSSDFIEYMAIRIGRTVPSAGYAREQALTSLKSLISSHNVEPEVLFAHWTAASLSQALVDYRGDFTDTYPTFLYRRPFAGELFSSGDHLDPETGLVSVPMLSDVFDPEITHNFNWRESNPTFIVGSLPTRHTLLETFARSTAIANANPLESSYVSLPPHIIHITDPDHSPDYTGLEIDVIPEGFQDAQMLLYSVWSEIIGRMTENFGTSGYKNPNILLIIDNLDTVLETHIPEADQADLFNALLSGHQEGVYTVASTTPAGFASLPNTNLRHGWRSGALDVLLTANSTEVPEHLDGNPYFTDYEKDIFGLLTPNRVHQITPDGSEFSYWIPREN